MYGICCKLKTLPCMQGQTTNFTMELTGPAIEQLASHSGNSDQFKQAVAALLPGISESHTSDCMCWRDQDVGCA